MAQKGLSGGAVGATVADEVGGTVGGKVGGTVADEVGAMVGATVGGTVGATVGDEDGKAVVGAKLGTLLGDGDGAIEGVKLFVHFGTVNTILNVSVVASVIFSLASVVFRSCNTWICPVFPPGPPYNAIPSEIVS